MNAHGLCTQPNMRVRFRLWHPIVLEVSSRRYLTLWELTLGSGLLLVKVFLDLD